MYFYIPFRYYYATAPVKLLAVGEYIFVFGMEEVEGLSRKRDAKWITRLGIRGSWRERKKKTKRKPALCLAAGENKNGEVEEDDDGRMLTKIIMIKLIK